MDELVEQFLIEGRELVQQASDDLLALEHSPGDRSRIDSAFRAFHTLKGAVGLFDLPAMAAVLHAAEDLLSALREGRSAVGPQAIDVLLECIEACDGWLDAFGQSGTLPPDAARYAEDLVASLEAPWQEASPRETSSSGADWLAPLAERQADAIAEAAAQGLSLTAVRYVPRANCYFLGDDPLALVRKVPDLVALNITSREPVAQAEYDPYSCNLVIELLSTAPPPALRKIFQLAGDQVELAEVTPQDHRRPAPAREEGRAARPEAAASLRITAARLDGLVDLAGELIVAANGLGDAVRQVATLDSALAARHAEIERLVGRLHRSLIGARAVPVASVFGRFGRPVRELATRLGKKVELVQSGAGIEVDKSVADGLYEPLLHILRNAIDHGMETPEVRRGLGKPPEGRLTLEAAQRADHVVVSVADDGAGIDPQRMRVLAAERGLMSEAEASALTDEAAAALIFEAGLSTAQDVTDVSGRGVGMDAVRTAVEAMGGRVGIDSRPGLGTTVRLTLPQRAAVLTVLTVAVGEQAFGIPIDAVQEIIRLPQGRISEVRAGTAFVWRDRTVPLVCLANLLKQPGPPPSYEDAKVLLTDTGGERVGIAVADVTGRFSGLLRPVPPLLASVPGLGGTMTTGSGDVLLVLDIPELLT
ncbi:chemotaxis protein CheA [Rhodobacter sp. NSM]|uniref:chemotaxis protein CheA n=1 Tax=Rhodobacter sp. NSM TaxID=3457501 RepID=UPI003FD2F812